MKKRILLLFMLALISSGCAANKFTEFYHPIYTAEQMQKASDYLEICTEPEMGGISLKQNRKALERSMYEKGYVLIGYSSFEASGNYGEKEAFLQAQQLGACIALWKAEYLRTENMTIAMSSYGPGSISTTYYGIGHLGGVYGFPSAYMGGYTQYVPVSKDFYSYIGAFFAKIAPRPNALGVAVGEPPLSYMKLTDGRDGILVKAVRIDGNAYKANIFRGDILVSINGKVCDQNSDVLNLQLGAENEIVLFRNGETIVKKIMLPSL